MNSSKKIFFDIIMPCYNSESYVRNAVNSLLVQHYPNWNLIAVNDGSKDSTLDILNEYAKNDSRIKVYSKENGGYATAINHGLDHITGDYFFMMGSDDRLAPELFSDIVSNIADELPDVIAFRAVKYMDGKAIGLDSMTNFSSVVKASNTTINDYEKSYPEHAKILFVRDTAKCYKRSLLGNLRYFGKYGFDADGIFSTLFVHRCQSFMSLPIDGYYWTLRADSVSATTNIPMDIDRMNNWMLFNQAVLKDATYMPAKFEISYFGKAHGMGMKLISGKERLDWALIKKIHQARKTSVEIANKFSFQDYLPKNNIKRFLLIKFPLIWTAIFRILTRKMRKIGN